MDRSSTASFLSMVALLLVSGCAPVDDDSDPISSTTSSAVTARVCPEIVTFDRGGQPRNAGDDIRQCWPGEARCSCDRDNDCYRLSGYRACTPRVAASGTTRPLCPEAVTIDRVGEPRNAAGRVRQCWPSQARCSCDRDNDCYAAPGYVACAPRPATGAPRDAGVRDTGVRDTGVRDTGVRDTGVRDTGVRDTGVAVTPPPPPPPATSVPPPVGTTTPSNGLRAFPGAEGFGASATGGRGGRVVYVTNLNTSGPGSFQDAAQQTGRRYILFKVSGVINGDVQLLGGDVTVAGQTSPGGITVRGLHTTEARYCDQQCGANARGVQNFIVRHLRSRPAQGTFPDALRLRYARNGVIDHLSMGNAQDEEVEISYANNITIQESIMAETIGDHARYGGMLINYSNPAAGYALDNLTIVRNVWNRIEGRYPEFSRESAGVGGTTMRVELTNNLLWDQRYFIDVNPTTVSGTNSGSNIFYQMNWVGNSSFASVSNRFGTIWLQPSGGGTSAYFADNRSNLWSNRQDWDLNYCCNNYDGRGAARPSWARAARHPFPAVTVMPASGVRAHALANAGAFPRDPMDRRLMAHVAAGTFDSRPINANPANDALSPCFAGAAPAAPADTDSDGMPDAWERARGLNPAAQDHNGTAVSVAITGVAGYTNLECYINELAALRVRNNR